MTKFGFVSIRNADGTSWATMVSEADWSWAGSQEKEPVSQKTFALMQSRVEDSKRGESSDYGMWNLTWHDATPEQAVKALHDAEAFRQADAEDDEFF